MNVFLAIAIPTAVLTLGLVAWATWATRKAWVINVNMDDRPDHYKQIEKELRDGT